MSRLFVSAVVAIVTLSEFVAESADKRVEIFAGQISDLAYAKIPSWYNEGGIAVHGTTDTRVHLHLQNSSFVTEGCTDSGYTPRHAPQASVFSARLRLDYENFDAPVMDGLAQGDNRGQN